MTTSPDEERPTGSGASDASAEQAVLDAAGDAVDGVAERELSPADVASMESLDIPRRLMLVHAHPDDETITSGATMARYAAAGAQVTLVTCTRGEKGEVIPPELQHLEGDDEALASHRVAELAAAMEALGVEDHRFLGDGALDGGGHPAPAHYSDSGMAYDDDGNAVAAPEMGPDAFALADVDVAAGHLVRVIREVRPQVLATYDPEGGYGHPDHVQAHLVAMRAVALAADPASGEGEPWQVAKVYWSMQPDDDSSTAVVDASEYLEAKVAALRAHGTQVVVGDGSFVLSNGITQALRDVERYRLAVGEARPPADGGPELDLFAGLA